MIPIRYFAAALFASCPLCAAPALAQQSFTSPVFDSFALKGPFDANGDFADSYSIAPSDWDRVSVSGGLGLTFMEANEYVYQTGGKLSQLIYDSVAVPVVQGSVSVPLAPGWRMSLNAEGGLGGDSYMEDYDWISPYATGFGMDDWSHRSQHPDTRVEHYLSAGLRLTNDLLRLPDIRAGINAELHYTDVQWSAYGGTYVYSSGGFRNSSGDFGNAKGITYRQMLPSLLIGGDMDATSGRWRTSASLQGGVTFAAQDIDNHWLRDLRFEDRFAPAPVVAGSFKLGYSLSGTADIHAGVSAQKVFPVYGDIVETDTSSGAVSTFGYGSSGADFISATVSAGLSGRF